MASAAPRLQTRSADPHLRELVQGINRELSRMQIGIDNASDAPIMNADLDLNGFNILNVGARGKNGEVLNRGELEDRAMLKNAQDQHVAHSSIIATSGIRSTRRAKEPHELVPLQQVQDMLGGGGGTLSLTAAAGLSFASNFFVMTPGDANHNVVLTPTNGQLRNFNRLILTADSGVSGFLQDAFLTAVPPGFISFFINESAFALKLIREGSGFGQPVSRIKVATDVIINSYRGFCMLYSAALNRWVLVQI